MATLTDDQKKFLDQPFVGVVTTLRADGSPHNTVVWVEVEDGIVSFNTALGRAKPKHLEQNPHAGVTVVDPNDPWKWVSVDGRAEVTTEGADAQIDRLSKKYLGKDEYPFRNPGEQRVTVRITPEHVSAAGIGDTT
jgi:PPOX class probable F420-dependent enzyme